MSPDSGSSGIASAEREGTAQQLAKKYMLMSLAVGLVPLPVVDLAALAAIQLQMLSRLAKQYDIQFSQQLGTSILGSLVGAGGSAAAGATSHRFVMHFIPGAWLVGAMGAALFAGASTFAVGKVFIQHFESGGTFLTLDPEKVRQYYAQQFERGGEEVVKTFAGIKP